MLNKLRSMFSSPQRNLYKQIVENLQNVAYVLKDLYPNHWRSFTSAGTGTRLKEELCASALYCGMEKYVGVITSIPRFMNSIDSLTMEVKRGMRTTDHPAARIWMHQAGPSLSSQNFMSHLITDVLWDGNFYALPSWNQSGQIADLRYINPSRIPSGMIKYAEGGEKLISRKTGTVRTASKNELIAIIASGQKESDRDALTIPYDELFHIRGMLQDTENHRGVGIRDNMSPTLSTAGYAQKFLQDFYSSGIRRQMFLSTEKEISAPVLSQLEKLLLKGSDDEQQDWGDKDIGDLFRARILPHGLKPIYVGQLFQQLQFIETRAFSNEDIARFLNIPPGLLYSFMGQGATPDSLEGMQALWNNQGLGPLMDWVGGQFRDQVLPVSSRPLYEFGFSRVYLLRTIPVSGSVTVRNLVETGILTVPDGRSIFGIRHESKGIQYVPANIITVKHGLALEKKAEQGLAIAEVQMQKMQQDMTHAAEVHQAAKENGFAPPKPPASPPPEKPAAGDNPPQDNRLKNAVRDRIVFKAVLDGLSDFEQRVISQKKNQHPEDASFRNAAVDWVNGKFSESVDRHLSRWTDCDWLPVTDIMSDWVSQSVDIIQNSPTPLEDLAESHSNRIALLMESLKDVKEDSGA